MGRPWITTFPSHWLARSRWILRESVTQALKSCQGKVIRQCRHSLGWLRSRRCWLDPQLPVDLRTEYHPSLSKEWGRNLLPWHPPWNQILMDQASCKLYFLKMVTLASDPQQQMTLNPSWLSHSPPLKARSASHWTAPSVSNSGQTRTKRCPFWAHPSQKKIL
jgi:hypothetical protein